MAQQFGPAPQQLKLKSGKIVTQRFYDQSQYHDNCRACGGDVYGQAIWYVRKNEANIAPKHAECPSEPQPYVEPQRPAYMPAIKSQSVYAQRRQDRREPPVQATVTSPVEQAPVASPVEQPAAPSMTIDEARSIIATWESADSRWESAKRDAEQAHLSEQDPSTGFYRWRANPDMDAYRAAMQAASSQRSAEQATIGTDRYVQAIEVRNAHSRARAAADNDFIERIAYGDGR